MTAGELTPKQRDALREMAQYGPDAAPGLTGYLFGKLVEKGLAGVDEQGEWFVTDAGYEALGWTR